MKEGQALRNYLKTNKISVSQIAEKFGISETTVYQYFKSSTLSEAIKAKFSTEYNIDFSTLTAHETTKKPQQRPRIDYLEEQIRIKDETIAKLSDTLNKLAAQLEKRMKL